jgi:serine/threonine-protein kinase RsbW
MRKGGRPPSRHSASVTLSNDPHTIRAVEEEVLAVAKDHGYPEAACFAIRLALEEAVYNAFRHGHRELPDEPVAVKWVFDENSLTITVTDKGPGFDPTVVPDPTREDRLELPHGRGLMLMKAYMTSITYNDRGNEVTMVYTKPEA